MLFIINFVLILAPVFRPLEGSLGVIYFLLKNLINQLMKSWFIYFNLKRLYRDLFGRLNKRNIEIMYI